MRATCACAVFALMLLTGCVTDTGEIIRFQAKNSSQTVAMRDGDSVITSRGRYSMITVKSAQHHVASRPVFVVGIQNTSNRQLDFVVSNTTAVYEQDGASAPLKVYTYDELVQEEKSAQVGRAVLASVVGGVNSGLAGRSGYRQAVASVQNDDLYARVAAEGQQNLEALINMG